MRAWSVTAGRLLMSNSRALTRRRNRQLGREGSVSGRASLPSQRGSVMTRRFEMLGRSKKQKSILGNDVGMDGLRLIGNAISDLVG